MVVVMVAMAQQKPVGCIAFDCYYCRAYSSYYVCSYHDWWQKFASHQHSYRLGLGRAAAAWTGNWRCLPTNLRHQEDPNSSLELHADLHHHHRILLFAVDFDFGVVVAPAACSSFRSLCD